MVRVWAWVFGNPGESLGVGMETSLVVYSICGYGFIGSIKAQHHGFVYGSREC